MLSNDAMGHIEYLENHGYKITKYDSINFAYLIIKKGDGIVYRPDIQDGKAEIVLELIYLRERNAELEATIEKLSSSD